MSLTVLQCRAVALEFENSAARPADFFSQLGKKKKIMFSSFKFVAVHIGSCSLVFDRIFCRTKFLDSCDFTDGLFSSQKFLLAYDGGLAY
jgi:hypothetical protein